MDEYIEREAAIRMLRGSAIGKYPLSFSSGIFASADELKKLPAADVAPVRHGRWLPYQTPVETRQSGWICNQCSGVTHDLSNGDTDYCPSCGAKMDL